MILLVQSLVTPPPPVWKGLLCPVLRGWGSRPEVTPEAPGFKPTPSLRGTSSGKHSPSGPVRPRKQLFFAVEGEFPRTQTFKSVFAVLSPRQICRALFLAPGFSRELGRSLPFCSRAGGGAGLLVYPCRLLSRCFLHFLVSRRAERARCLRRKLSSGTGCHSGRPERGASSATLLREARFM